MSEYRFHLQKYKLGNRYACPQCGCKRCFARYIDEQGQIVFPDNVGRCDHEQSCGYHYSPSDYFKDNPDANCNDDWRYKTSIFMSDNKKQMMDIQKVKSFSVAVSDEHQRNWGEDLFSRKENDPKYNYDRSRTRLNFQVSKGGELGPVDKSKSITEKIEQAIKNRVTGRVNVTSNRAVSIVFGDNREQMRKLAFGDQTINENGNNWDVDSCSGIDRWATDIYDFCCREFGEENVASFIVHLDELNPHAHAVIVPITKDGRLSAKDMFGGNDMNQARTRMMKPMKRKGLSR